jgi:tetratricopeptide (TPR) repeat protein
MAHKTRKKLTKKEIKRDPVGEKLEATLIFIQTHQKEVIGGLIGIIIIILVGQYFMSRKNTASEESMAGFITAGQIFSQSATAASMNQMEQAFQGMDAAYSMAMQTWNNNPQNSWARKSAVLAAKIDIIRGNHEAAISTLSTLLAANPDKSIRIPALLHMGIVLENRGSEQDMINAAASYRELLEIADEDVMAKSEALYGLSRISFQMNRNQESLEYLEQAMAMGTDTTTFEKYMITRLSNLTE